jgi:hypothetical protein
MDKQKIRELIDNINIEDLVNTRLGRKKPRGKGPKFIVDSKGRVKKMYKKGGEVTKFKGHF